MEEMVTIKLENYDKIISTINNLKEDLNCALNEAGQAKVEMNKLVKAIIEASTNSDFDGATVEDIKSGKASKYIYYSDYNTLKYFYTDDVLKEFLTEIKKEQANETDN